MKKVYIIFLVSSLFLFGCNKVEKVEYKEKSVEKEEMIEVVATDLEIPWDLEFLPDGRMMVTERPGRILIIGENKEKIELVDVSHSGEGGLLGLVLDPDFENNKFIYVYLTYKNNDGQLMNKVERYRFGDNELSDRKVTLDGIKGASYHDGGRIEFGPDGYLYITTGDAGQTDLSQDIKSLSGKILRINKDGTIPSDNPFENEVFAYGLRNSQGIAWDDKNNLWATDHGPSGSQSGFDELNLIEAGSNYGWPVIKGDETKENMKVAEIQSGADETWAPAGAVFYNGRIFFVGLRGETIYEYDLNKKELKRYFEGEWGRLRDVELGLEKKYLYVLTSNRDDRGEVKKGDDKIIKIDISYFDGE